MKRQIIPILGLAGLALSGLSAHAQQFNYNSGDLILDFSESGYSDVEVDIGSVANLNSEAQANGGTAILSGSSYNISSPVYNVTTQLLDTYGGSLSGVSFAVVGTTITSPAYDATDWLSDPQTGAGPNTPYNDLGSTQQGQVNGVVESIIGISSKGILGYSAAAPANSVNNTANVAIISPTGSYENDSYTKTVGASFNGAPTNPKTYSSGSLVSDLFEYDPNSVGQSSVYEGDFTLNSDGSLDYTVESSAVPEPASFGILAGGALLFYSFRNQLRRTQA